MAFIPTGGGAVRPEDWHFEYYNTQLYFKPATAEMGLAQVIPGVLANTNVPDYTTGAGATFQAASDSFTPLGANKMANKRWAPVIIDDDQQFGLMSFINSAIFQPAEWSDRSLLEWPDEFVQLFLQFLAEYRGQQLEGLIWLSDNTLATTPGTPNHNLSFIDGYVKQMRADGTIKKVSNALPTTAGATTATERNILEAMKLLRAQCPAVLQATFGMTGVPYVMSINDFVNKFVPALTGLNVNVSNANTFPIVGMNYPYSSVDPQNPTFLGYPIVVLPFVPDNFMFITTIPRDERFKNLKIAAADWGNINNVRVVDMRGSTNEDLIRAKTRFNIDVQYMRGDRIALYDAMTPTINVPDIAASTTGSTTQNLQGGVLEGFNRNGLYGTFSQVSALPAVANITVTLDAGDGIATTLPKADVGIFDSVNNALLPARVKVVTTGAVPGTYTYTIKYRIAASFGHPQIDKDVTVRVIVS